jgi:hypothetical protein
MYGHLLYEKVPQVLKTAIQKVAKKNKHLGAFSILTRATALKGYSFGLNSLFTPEAEQVQVGISDSHWEVIAEPLVA